MTEFVKDEQAKCTETWSMKLEPELKSEISVLKPALKGLDETDLLETIRVAIRKIVADGRSKLAAREERAS
jgi:hypothetical protein